MQRYPFLSIIDRIDVGALQSFEHVDNVVAQLNSRIAKMYRLVVTGKEATVFAKGSSLRRLGPSASRVASLEFVYSSAWSRIDAVAERDLKIADLCK